MSEETHEPFKSCGSCRHVWERWSDLILDPRLRFLGFQASREWPQANAFVFEHSCGTSVSVLASRLRHLLDEPAADTAWLYGSENCGKHCPLIDDHGVCDRPCANARDRRLLKLLLEIRREGRLPGRLAGDLERAP